MLTKLKDSFTKKNEYHSHNKFKVAFNGIKVVFKEESSFRYQFILLVLTVVFGLMIGLTRLEWITIVFAAILVFTFEMVNTAIENIIDIVSPDYSKMAGKIKDISAGAVLLSSIGAAIIGLLIFMPRIINFF